MRVGRTLGTGAGKEDPPDTVLLARAVAGDRQAFVAVLLRHDGRLRALAAKLLGGDDHRMDDALQEAYVRAFRALPQFRGDADVGTWLYRIVYTTCIDELRRGNRRPEPVDPGDTADRRREPRPSL